ncbi:ATP synthase subunit I [Nocardioides taihuensis]|uniref:ATP synthase subunit I n=1 Tax=Nocardioides taihuensis TaxID=1835606 RepID=A0ABW0BM27_9ACTN
MSEPTTPTTAGEQTPPTAVSPDAGGAGSDLPEKASVLQVVKDQKKTILVAVTLVVATYWVAGQFGEWRLAGCVALGVLLGLVNHLATEYWLLKIITSGEQPSRETMMASTMVRLGVLSVVAIGAAVVLWPDGIGLLLGLAIFRLIALVLTSVPLLKELKKQ